MRIALLALLAVIGLPGLAFAEDNHELHVHPISIVPFAVLLLSIAILPLVTGHFWHKNSNKLIVALSLSAPVLAYLVFLGAPGVHGLSESLLEYVQFIALLASLYTVSGNIVLEGDLEPSPAVNLGLLALGAVLANFIGTTGASMLLIRPYLKINARRKFKGHLPVFFIFIVSNLGGLLTPLGDPPLFLGDGVFQVRNGVADVDIFNADDGANIARADFIVLDPAQAVERVNLLDRIIDPTAVGFE